MSAFQDLSGLTESEIATLGIMEDEGPYQALSEMEICLTQLERLRGRHKDVDEMFRQYETAKNSSQKTLWS